MHVVTIVVLHEVTLVLRLWSWYVLTLVLAIIDLTLVSRALVARSADGTFTGGPNMMSSTIMLFIILYITMYYIIYTI